MTVALDTELPPWLVEEGMVRDLIRQVQVMRKDAGFRVEERIALGIVGADEVVSRAVEAHREFIMEQTLARELGDSVGHADFSGEAQVGDSALTLSLRRLG